MQCKIHTPATKLQIEFNQAAMLGRRDCKFIRRGKRHVYVFRGKQAHDPNTN